MTEPVADSRISRWVPLAAGLVAFALYTWLTAPGMYWLDSQELGSAAVRLGVPHPTGFSLIMLAGRVAAWIPVGELAFRVHLMCAAGAAVAVGAVAGLVIDLAGADVVGAGAALGAAVILGASFTFFRQATATEVYAPTAAFLALALRAAVRVIRGGNGLGLALFAGLGATGVHASFRLLLGIPLVVIYLWRLRRGARWPVASLGLVMLGAAGAAVYLPLRSASGHIDDLDWGHARTVSGFIDHLSAGRIRRAFAAEMLSGDTAALAGHARELGELLEGDLGVLALLASAGGVVWLLRRRGRRGAGGLVLAMVIGDVIYSVWINPMGLSDRQNLTPSAVGLALLAGVGLAAAARWFGRAAPFAAGALALIASVQPVLAKGGDKLAAAGSETPRAYAEASLAQAPPGAILLAKNDSTIAGLFWLTLAEPDRPDVAALARQHLWDTRRDAAVLARIGVPMQPGLGWAAIVGSGRAVLWEPADDSPPDDVPFAFDQPFGRLGPGVSVTPRASIAALERAFAGDATDDEITAQLAVREYTNLGVMAAGAGDFAAAAEVVERAIPIAGDDVRPLLNAARYRMTLGDDARARTFAVAAVTLAPRHATAWAILGVLDARAGRCDDARAHLDRALAIDPREPDALTNRPRLETQCKPR